MVIFYDIPFALRNLNVTFICLSRVACKIIPSRGGESIEVQLSWTDKHRINFMRGIVILELLV